MTTSGFENEGYGECEVGETEWLAEMDALRMAETDRFQPIPGLTLDGKPVMQDVETGDLVGVSSCDALRIMDGVA